MKHRYFTLSLLWVTMLVACSPIEVPMQSSVQIPTQFDKLPSTSPTMNPLANKPNTMTDLRQWWKLWQDPQLDQLIDMALQNNTDIALAQARLEEARAMSGLAQADKGPKVGASGSLGRADTRLEDLPLIDSHNDRIQGGGVNLVASWEPDFFGKKRSDAQAALYAALSKEEQWRATQLAVVSAVAQNYFQFNGAQQQYALLQKNIAVLQQLQRYVQGRFNAGYVTQYEVDEVGNKILTLQSHQAALQAKADSLQRQIAVLVGATPQSFKLNTNTAILKHSPTAPTGKLPGEVLNRRPDIQAYSLAVNARAAQVASAKADLYPRFDIQFLGHGGRISLSQDLSSFSEFASIISLGVQLPIFTNGRIQANINAADARLKASLIEYDKALLKALAEVDSYYQLTNAFTQKVSLLENRVQQQQKQANQANILFQHGNKTLDNVLTARLDMLAAEQDLLDARLQHHENMVLLYKALGGDW